MRTDPHSSSLGATILVVDDEAPIRKMLEMGLQMQGFHVYLAADGNQGIERYRENQETVDVVLLDVQMPVLDGPATLRALRQINPEVRCCLMSGHAGGYSREQFMELGAADLLGKPFTLAEAADVLRRLACGATNGCSAVNYS